MLWREVLTPNTNRSINDQDRPLHQEEGSSSEQHHLFCKQHRKTPMGTTKTAPTPLPYPHKNVEKPWAKYQTSRRCPRHLYNSLVAAATSPPPHPAITTTSTAMTTSTSLHHHHQTGQIRHPHHQTRSVTTKQLIYIL
jgi:hypothetical protein